MTRAPIDEALDRFAVLRRSNLRLLANAKPDDLQRVGVHAERGEESVAPHGPHVRRSRSAAPATTRENPQGRRTPRVKRLESVDVLRGGVMVVMALDHVRDFFGGAAIRPIRRRPRSPCSSRAGSPTSVRADVLPADGRRAPFSPAGQRPAGDLSRYLLLRGLWLIALEIVVVRCLGLQFNVDYRTTMLTVLVGARLVDDRARRARASAGRRRRRRVGVAHDRGAQPLRRSARLDVRRARATVDGASSDRRHRVEPAGTSSSSPIR